MGNEQLEIVTLDPENIDSEHICCAIGKDKTNAERAKIKKGWLKERLPEGHVFKKFDVRGKVFIEYVPAEYAWFPIDAPGYTLIQCFWVSGRYKGQGLGGRLLAECEKDCLEKNGIVAVSSSKKQPFLMDKAFFTYKGFQVCDTANPYFVLLVKKFRKDAPMPRFNEKAKKAELKGKKGLTFYYSDLCPYNADFVDVMISAAAKYKIPCEKIKVTSLEQAKDLPTPFGIFSVFYNEEFLTHELMTEGKFDKLPGKTIQA
jgi:GNAT superfamily N-acetyltransferase